MANLYQYTFNQRGLINQGWFRSLKGIMQKVEDLATQYLGPENGGGFISQDFIKGENLQERVITH
jgi:hypothetical protein